MLCPRYTKGLYLPYEEKKRGGGEKIQVPLRPPFQRTLRITSSRGVGRVFLFEKEAQSTMTWWNKVAFLFFFFLYDDCYYYFVILLFAFDRAQHKIYAPVVCIEEKRKERKGNKGCPDSPQRIQGQARAFSTNVIT